MNKDVILIVGSNGQLGTVLTEKLRLNYGAVNVIASDLYKKIGSEDNFITLDATDFKAVEEVVLKNKITQIYHLAAILSAAGEKNPLHAWDLNMVGLLNVLEVAKTHKVDKVFWPSSIAVFGPTTPKINTRQKTIMEPSTVYGISKLAGEFWCNYYHQKYDVDVRSLRYPGIISWKTKPGGGTTDYAVDIYFKAVKDRKYKCYLSKDTRLPMMYMEDAVNATIALMQADRNRIKIRTSYNLAAIDFTPEEISEEIKKHLPDFEISYQPDFRQKIADSWPQSIDDSEARIDWNWQHEFNLKTMTKDILNHIQKK